jgi:hypothetical protein
MRKILLFTGAGMSVPMGLPSATGFANTLAKCDPTLMDLLKSHIGDKAKDIEQILFVLEEFINGSTFYKHVLNQHTSNGNYTPLFNNIAAHSGKAIRFQQVVKSDIFQILQKFNSEDALNIYLNLLKIFKQINSEFSLSIFTTNYDLIFEDIVGVYSDDFEKLGYTDFYYGFTTRWGKMRYDKSADFGWSKDIIEYNKLHGSLDWTKDNKGIVVKTGAITLPAVPDDMPLLYPGYKDTPTDEPFISIHNKLYVRLMECDEVHVIGFAFRDPYINSIFQFALRGKPELTINCYNPSPIKDLPVESAIPLFIKNAPKQFLYNEWGIENSDNPLNIAPF